MLTKNISIRLSLLACLLGLSACGTETSRLFAPDPSLQQQQPELSSPSPSATPLEAQTQLPNEFPQEIPLYPEAELQSVTPNSTAEQGKGRWIATEPSLKIISYYQDALSSDGWELVEAGEDNLVARRDDLEVTVSIPAASANQNETEFAIAYQRQGNTAQSELESEPAASTRKSTGVSSGSRFEQAQIASDRPQEFSDLDRSPEQLRQYIEDLAALGVLTADKNTSNGQFNPDEPITRRDYARWLVAANNRLYADREGEQIHLASRTAEPAFSDVSKSDPDFAVIQGLAETGLIPSPLTGDSSAVSFRPDAPLTREDLITWKVPLDIRTALPSASIDSVKETWGFQDTAKINPMALRSLYADFQNAEQSNVRRVFGYTTLFQPTKPVTRAEAAATLWYFGSEGEGISAQEIGDRGQGTGDS